MAKGMEGLGQLAQQAARGLSKMAERSGSWLAQARQAASAMGQQSERLRTALTDNVTALRERMSRGRPNSDIANGSGSKKALADIKAKTEKLDGIGGPMQLMQRFFVYRERPQYGRGPQRGDTTRSAEKRQKGRADTGTWGDARKGVQAKEARARGDARRQRWPFDKYFTRRGDPGRSGPVERGREQQAVTSPGNQGDTQLAGFTDRTSGTEPVAIAGTAGSTEQTLSPYTHRGRTEIPPPPSEPPSPEFGRIPQKPPESLYNRPAQIGEPQALPRQNGLPSPSRQGDNPQQLDAPSQPSTAQPERIAGESPRTPTLGSGTIDTGDTPPGNPQNQIEQQPVQFVSYEPGQHPQLPSGQKPGEVPADTGQLPAPAQHPTTPNAPSDAPQPLPPATANGENKQLPRAVDPPSQPQAIEGPKPSDSSRQGAGVPHEDKGFSEQQVMAYDALHPDLKPLVERLPTQEQRQLLTMDEIQRNDILRRWKGFDSNQLNAYLDHMNRLPPGERTQWFQQLTEVQGNDLQGLTLKMQQEAPLPAKQALDRIHQSVQTAVKQELAERLKQIPVDQQDLFRDIGGNQWSEGVQRWLFSLPDDKRAQILELLKTVDPESRIAVMETVTKLTPDQQAKVIEQGAHLKNMTSEEFAQFFQDLHKAVPDDGSQAEIKQLVDDLEKQLAATTNEQGRVKKGRYNIPKQPSAAEQLKNLKEIAETRELTPKELERYYELEKIVKNEEADKRAKLWLRLLLTIDVLLVLSSLGRPPEHAA